MVSSYSHNNNNKPSVFSSINQAARIWKRNCAVTLPLSAQQFVIAPILVGLGIRQPSCLDLMNPALRSLPSFKDNLYYYISKECTLETRDWNNRANSNEIYAGWGAIVSETPNGGPRKSRTGWAGLRWLTFYLGRGIWNETEGRDRPKNTQSINCTSLSRTLHLRQHSLVLYLNNPR